MNIKKFEGFFSKSEDKKLKSEDKKLNDIEEKISDAAFSLKSFGTMNTMGSFKNGVKWAIHNLTDEEIKYVRENTDKDDHSFFGF